MRDLAFRPYVIVPVLVLALLAPIFGHALAVIAGVAVLVWIVLALRDW